MFAMDKPLITIMGAVHEGLPADDEDYYRVCELFTDAASKAGWPGGAPFRSLCLLFVFDEDCPPIEIVILDKARDNELLVRCNVTSDEARAAARASAFQQLLADYTKRAMAEVAHAYQLPALPL